MRIFWKFSPVSNNVFNVWFLSNYVIVHFLKKSDISEYVKNSNMAKISAELRDMIAVCKNKPHKVATTNKKTIVYK